MALQAWLPPTTGGEKFTDATSLRLPNSTRDSFSEKDRSSVRRVFLKELKDPGVDWSKTCSPESRGFERFRGTFTDSETEDVLLGVLVLNNGIKQEWYGKNIEVKNVFDMMASVQKAEERFNEIFG